MHRQHRKFASSLFRIGYFQRFPETRNVGLGSFKKTAEQESKDWY